MLYGTYDLIRPLHFIQSGQFTYGVGWQHARSTRKKDTELLIGTSNETNLSVQGQVFILKPGSCLSVFPGETIIGTKPAEKSASFIWLHFLNQSSLNYTKTYPTQLAEYTSVLPRFFQLNRPEKIIALASQLLDITHSESRVVSEDYVTTLLVSEISTDYLHGINQKPYDEGRVKQIEDWINASIFDDFKISEIADQFNISQDYLSRLFKRTTGITVKDYINKSRVDFARYFLLTTDWSISEIADKCAFNDYKYFFRIFKHYVNLTPLKYRNTFTNTFLNNPKVDFGFDVGKVVSLLEKGLDTSIIY
ncbi:transcriptional regulator, AraC family [Paucilactobacillus vaccinostercus DSM 20634]|uniref:Transcriptional regulator, AraC family n=1 Tax=Paucilactobacillus vaccinostercus DSM 20634 TaxID=1423813 RepID=A0A0R2AAB0_9LACO|nr:AraC family transcriptional regulator [Paucilactobacillus vaccinostercus]KRM60697.1 transcriptional regulator, AraC family [Paucilactobacillus vaccinostercus DSM 20634]